MPSIGYLGLGFARRKSNTTSFSEREEEHLGAATGDSRFDASGKTGEDVPPLRRRSSVRVRQRKSLPVNECTVSEFDAGNRDPLSDTMANKTGISGPENNTWTALQASGRGVVVQPDSSRVVTLPNIEEVSNSAGPTSTAVESSTDRITVTETSTATEAEEAALPSQEESALEHSEPERFPYSSSRPTVWCSYSTPLTFAYRSTVDVPARNMSSNSYTTARTNSTASYITAPSRNPSAAANNQSGALPIFTPDLRLDLKSLVSRVQASRHMENSRTMQEATDLSLSDFELDLALERRLRNVSKLRKANFDLCSEPWALGTLCTWLQLIFQHDTGFELEELILALAGLFLYKSLLWGVADAHQCGATIARRLLEAEPRILLVNKELNYKWSDPPKKISGVFPILTSIGCYSPRTHEVMIGGPCSLRCYSKYCSNPMERQPTDVEIDNFEFSSPLDSRNSIGISDWHKLLKSMHLLPTPEMELDWSGRGQHAEFKRLERPPLIVERALGHGAYALVESVRCRRVRLARKRVRCNWRMKREDAIREVAHLQSAQHAHIVRVVGTYVVEKEKDLFILMYPVAEYHLGTFMDEVENDGVPDFQRVLLFFFPCLASTLAFLHEKQNIKHMDIKPENILVRNIEHVGHRHLGLPYKVYLADFGIARSYTSSAESETNSATSFTPLYAAPEVANQDTRGFKVDVFSLGCVFAEMMAVSYFVRDRLADLRESSGHRPFHANISAVQTFLRNMVDSLPLEQRGVCLLIADMINQEPKDRPRAVQVRNRLRVQGLTCFAQEPEKFEVARSLLDT